MTGDDRGYLRRVVAVSGATGALGAAVLRKLLELGADCHIPVRGRGGWNGETTGGGTLRVHQHVDLTDEAAVVRFYEELPGLWASIHCAGAYAMAPIVDTSSETLAQMWELNARSAFLCCREAARAMRRQGSGGGRIVNVAARPALEPRFARGMVAYAMSKAAVAALTVALSEEFAEESIWVNAVAPGLLDTPPNRKAMPDADFAKWTGVDDVAETIVFLASPANGATRGAVVPVYGRS